LEDELQKSVHHEVNFFDKYSITRFLDLPRACLTAEFNHKKTGYKKYLLVCFVEVHRPDEYLNANNIIGDHDVASSS
jgi:hypothetical protein